MGFFTKEVGKKIVKAEEDQEEEEQEEEDQDTYKIVAYCGDDEDSYDVIFRGLTKEKAMKELRVIYDRLQNIRTACIWNDEMPETDDEYWQGARVYNLAMYNSFEIKIEGDD